MRTVRTEDITKEHWRYPANSTRSASRSVNESVLEHSFRICRLIVTPRTLPSVFSKVGLPLVILIVQMLVNILQEEECNDGSQDGETGSDQEGNLVSLVRVISVRIQDTGEDLFEDKVSYASS